VIRAIHQVQLDLWRLIESKTEGTKPPVLPVLKISGNLFTLS
jgi:hypothetical protein